MARKWTLIAAAPALGLAACGSQPSTTMEPPLAGADIGGEFELTSETGETARWSDFDGSYRVVYFGYAYCPDVCPTDVQRIGQALRNLEREDPALANEIQPIFITIDPERDTTEVVRQFTDAFHDRMIGLTGTPEQIKAAADTFRVFYSRGEESAAGGYLMNHSNITYLFGKQGEPLATLPTDQGPDAVAAEIRKWAS